jgi:membrane-associated phospholipid phosphatase
LFPKVISLAILLCLAFSVAFSRVVLGMHSIDQVAFGACLGLWIALFFQFCLWPPIYTEISLILSDKDAITPA